MESGTYLSRRGLTLHSLLGATTTGLREAYFMLVSSYVSPCCISWSYQSPCQLTLLRNGRQQLDRSSLTVAVRIAQMRLDQNPLLLQANQPYIGFHEHVQVSCSYLTGVLRWEVPRAGTGVRRWQTPPTTLDDALRSMVLFAVHQSRRKSTNPLACMRSRYMP
jgi:hypothetical protein